MKRVLHSLRKGDRVEAAVVEAEGSALIVSLSGDLIRVINRTGVPLRRGARVWVEVTSQEPLAFRLSSISAILERTE